MKDYTINGWPLRFDNGTSRVIRDARDIKEENALDGLTDWQSMAPWILFGGWNRRVERNKDIDDITPQAARSLLEDLSPAETIGLINAYVSAMSITVDGDQPAAVEGEEPKKS